MKCKACGKEIGDQCQQGGMHIACHNTEITVYKIYDIDSVNGKFYAEADINEVTKAIETLQDYDDEVGFGVRCTTMTQGEYYNFPEFEGF